METVLAFVVDQVRVARLPTVIVAGDADRLAVGVACCTVTEVADVAVPPAPVAVNVYCVVADGDTFMDPEAATEPMPWLMEIDVAFVVVQVRVAEFPAVMVTGDADSVAIGAAGGSAGGKLVPPQPDSEPTQVRIPNANKARVHKRTIHPPEEWSRCRPRCNSRTHIRFGNIPAFDAVHSDAHLGFRDASSNVQETSTNFKNRWLFMRSNM